jgi:tetratricopeptide (TPR) repeat protein
MRISSRFPAAVVVGLVACGGVSLYAKFFVPQIENVPIERVLQNLERRAQEQPSDIETRLNLARVHAMAYASKMETAPVLKPTNPQQTPSNEPEFGVITSQFAEVRVVPATDATIINLARQHLVKAIENYDAIIKIDPRHLIARLGRAWCLDQSGDKPAAIAGYRDFMKDAWSWESAGNLPRLMNFMPMTEEVSRYLLPLLDPVKDAAEIQEIRSRLEAIKRMPPRAITPIAIPLTDRVNVSDLVDRSTPVIFDADGSGIPKPWTWISPQAGWLVFDKNGRKQVDSALDMFGNVTFWLFWKNGYNAMSALDDNGDGELSGKELDGLSIWLDANKNGKTDTGEVRPLADWHIESLSCRFEWVEDDPNLAAWSPAGVTFDTGLTRPTFDLLLYPK